MNQSRDIDDDGKYDHPLSAPAYVPAGSYNAKDAWGHDYSYCARIWGHKTVPHPSMFSNNKLQPHDSYNNHDTSLLTGGSFQSAPDAFLRYHREKRPATQPQREVTIYLLNSPRPKLAKYRAGGGSTNGTETRTRSS